MPNDVCPRLAWQHAWHARVHWCLAEKTRPIPSSFIPSLFPPPSKQVGEAPVKLQRIQRERAAQRERFNAEFQQVRGREQLAQGAAAGALWQLAGAWERRLPSCSPYHHWLHVAPLPRVPSPQHLAKQAAKQGGSDLEQLPAHW